MVQMYLSPPSGCHRSILHLLAVVFSDTDLLAWICFMFEQVCNDNHVMMTVSQLVHGLFFVE